MGDRCTGYMQVRTQAWPQDWSRPVDWTLGREALELVRSPHSTCSRQHERNGASHTKREIKRNTATETVGWRGGRRVLACIKIQDTHYTKTGPALHSISPAPLPVSPVTCLVPPSFPASPQPSQQIFSCTLAPPQPPHLVKAPRHTSTSPFLSTSSLPTAFFLA